MGSDAEYRPLSLPDCVGSRSAARLGSTLAPGRESRPRTLCQDPRRAARSRSWRSRNNASGIPQESRPGSSEIGVETMKQGLTLLALCAAVIAAAYAQQRVIIFD